ncbi:MAG: HAD-IIIA family hydrolase [Candidatus Nomurabacteria bacterium]|jgi:HAD superfamily phosphatase (TIGR01668 family)|nr:HAD-IIIA family hydrolase [Candidatus Nomurabacteria bacterium]
MKIRCGLMPDVVVKEVERLSPQWFKSVGVRAVAFDVDGTLMNYHEHKVEPEITRYLESLRTAGLKLFIVSNAYFGRAKELEQLFGCFGATVLTPGGVYTGERFESKNLGSKPKPSMLREAAQLAKLKSGEKIAMVGDQMFKDVLSANKLDVAVSVLVARRGKGDFIGIKLLQRPLETLIRTFLPNVPSRWYDFPEEPTFI